MTNTPRISLQLRLSRRTREIHDDRYRYTMRSGTNSAYIKGRGKGIMTTPHLDSVYSKRRGKITSATCDYQTYPDVNINLFDKNRCDLNNHFVNWTIHTFVLNTQTRGRPLIYTSTALYACSRRFYANNKVVCTSSLLQTKLILFQTEHSKSIHHAHVRSSQVAHLRESHGAAVGSWGRSFQ